MRLFSTPFYKLYKKNGDFRKTFAEIKHVHLNYPPKMIGPKARENEDRKKLKQDERRKLWRDAEDIRKTFCTVISLAQTISLFLKEIGHHSLWKLKNGCMKVFLSYNAFSSLQQSSIDEGSSTSASLFLFSGFNAVSFLGCKFIFSRTMCNFKPMCLWVPTCCPQQSCSSSRTVDLIGLWSTTRTLNNDFTNSNIYTLFLENLN